MIAYDDSDGWYDHQEGSIIRQSQDTADTLSGAGKCGSGATAPAQNDKCGVGPRQPLLVISPWAKQNYVDNTFTDQASIPRFIEENWGLGGIGNGSADSAAGQLINAFDFNPNDQRAPEVLLNDSNGEVSKIIPAPAPNSSSPSSASSTTSSSTSGSQVAAPQGATSGTSGSTSTGSSHAKTQSVVFPKLTVASKVRSGHLIVTCTTQGGSKLSTLLRLRLYSGRKLLGNQSALVRSHKARFTLRRKLRSGRYRVTLSVDLGGHVEAVSRTLRLG